jgi:hypothetical protein
VTLSSRTLPQLAARLAVAGGELCLPDAAAFSYLERTRLTRVFTLLHQAGQPGRGFRERRALRREAQAEWAALLSARSAAGARAEPRLPSGYAVLAQGWDEGERQLTALRALAPLAGLEDAPEAATAALAADQETPWKLPRLRELAAAFGAHGLAPLLDEVGDASVAPDEVAAAFDYAWHWSILDQIRIRDPDYGAALDEIAEDFRIRDTEHLAANRARVRSAWASQLRETVDRHPLQARVIRKQAALRRGHLPLRRLLDQTADVLFALKPCWAMSPLMVSQVLPLTRLFDLVIFDEASQLVPADAIRAAGGVLQRPDLRRRADHVPRRGPRRLPAARGRRLGPRAGPGVFGRPTPRPSAPIPRPRLSRPRRPRRLCPTTRPRPTTRHCPTTRHWPARSHRRRTDHRRCKPGARRSRCPPAIPFPPAGCQPPADNSPRRPQVSCRP